MPSGPAGARGRVLRHSLTTTYTPRLWLALATSGGHLQAAEHLSPRASSPSNPTSRAGPRELPAPGSSAPSLPIPMEAPGSHVPPACPMLRAPWACNPPAPAWRRPLPRLLPSLGLSQPPDCAPSATCPPLTGRHREGPHPLMGPSPPAPPVAVPGPQHPSLQWRVQPGRFPSPRPGGPARTAPGPCQRLCLLHSPSLAPNSDPGPSGPARGASVKGASGGVRGRRRATILVSSVSQAWPEGLALELGAGLSKAGGSARTGLPPLLRPRPCPGMFHLPGTGRVWLCHRPPPCVAWHVSPRVPS